MSQLSQDNRALTLSTPLGKDVLAIQSFTLTEGISKLFSMQLEMISEKRDIKPEQMVGQRVTLSIATVEENSKKQHVNGFVSRFYQGGQDPRVRTYYAEVVPWLWYLTQCTNLLIFQHKTVPEIITKVLQDRGFTDFQMKVQGTFEPREYCVQYRESDFAFLSRLMEEEGIFYFFEHADGKHTLIIANEPGVHKDAPDFAKYQYVPSGGEKSSAGGVMQWRLSKAFRTGKFAINDYQFLTPQNSLLVSAPSVVKLADNAKYEQYDYPGAFAKRFDGDNKMGKVRPDGDRTVKLRMQEVEAQHHEATGLSTLPGMCSGCKFELEDTKDFAGSYVLTQVRHMGEQSPSYFSNDALAQPLKTTFTCIPAAVPFRPQRVTQKPIVHGVQTAVVVGMKGEEIDTDKYGRVKVQFHWDREGRKDQNSSCWVRVGTMWGGAQWGMVHIPRIGQEVIVAFLEGDPDQPIIVGSVYNYDNMPPYTLPDNKTQSGVKSRSSKGGRAENFNEIRFEDKKDEEQVYIHAEKNMDIVVENDETHKVGFDKKDKGNQTLEVFNSQTVNIGTAKCTEGSQTFTIWKDRTGTLETGNDTLKLKKGNREALIEMGNDTLTIKLGNQTTKLNLGKSETEAMQSIELKVGQSSLKVDQSGVTIKGIMVQVEGTAMTQVKGAMTQVQGSGMLQLSGGVVMLG